MKKTATEDIMNVSDLTIWNLRKKKMNFEWSFFTTLH